MAATTADQFRSVHSSDLAATLHLSQQAPSILHRQPVSKTDAALSTPVRNPDEPETIEQLFFACLQTGDDKSALQCLDRLTKSFGASNERVTGLQGLYEEALAEGLPDLEKCLEKYNGILAENPVNVVCRVVQLLESRVAYLVALTANYETPNRSSTFNVQNRRRHIRFDRTGGGHYNRCRGLV